MQLLRAHPKCWPVEITVHFIGFENGALVLEVGAWFVTTDGNEFKALREGLLLDVMRLIAKQGTTLAIPTQAVQLMSAPIFRVENGMAK
jgi:MscS family membrane protein